MFMEHVTIANYNNILLQVAALAPLALLLVLEARCASIILCCGVVHHCSYTALITMIAIGNSSAHVQG